MPRPPSLVNINTVYLISRHTFYKISLTPVQTRSCSACGLNHDIFFIASIHVVHRRSHYSSSASPSTTRVARILSSSTGLSSAPVGTSPMRFTIAMPFLTRPKMVCLPSSHGVGASVMKNCDPLVLGPEFAMLSTPAPVCLRAGEISSSNFSP